MEDRKKIRDMLWHSFDMMAVKKWFFAGIFLAVFICLLVWVEPSHLSREENGVILVIMHLIFSVPFFVFCVVRTIRIFAHAESYTFCKAKLTQPIAGRIRGTIRFRVLIEDADGEKFPANTHSVFSVNGEMWPSLENYINKTVTVGYNEETGIVVVIG